MFFFLNDNQSLSETLTFFCLKLIKPEISLLITTVYYYEKLMQSCLERYIL
jgi:hypothetical protein